MHYLNTGNIFSKSLLMIEKLGQSQGVAITSSLIITKDENIKKYINIFNCLKTPLTEIKCISEFIDCVYNNLGNFILNEKIFYLNFPSIYKLEKDFLITLKKNDYIEIDELINKLNDLGYKFREFLNGGDYKKVGDTIYVKLKNKNETIVISFFGDIIENIFIQEEKNNTEIASITIGKISPIYFFEANEKFREELLQKLIEKNIVIDSLDIGENYEKFDILKNALYFEILKNHTKNQVNLGVCDLFIKNLEEFINILKSGKEISIYTKNKKTILNFLEYNNITKVQVFEKQK